MFQTAARARYMDGVTLAGAGRSTAAIYVWGYVAEMVLKACYFSAIGFSYDQPIRLTDLQAARAKSSGLGVPWQGNFHQIESWSHLLVAERASMHGHAYPAAYASEIVGHAARLYRHWREWLRYHHNRAYAYEVAQARLTAEWFLLDLLARGNQ